MFCSKCGTLVKEGTKFCHDCGFNLIETHINPATQPKLPQQENSTPNYGAKNKRPLLTNKEFDISKIPIKDWTFAGIAFLGIIIIFLGNQDILFFNGIHEHDLPLSLSAFLSVIGFLSIAVCVIFGQFMGLNEKGCNQIILSTSIGVAVISLLLFLTNLFYIFSLLDAVVLILIGSKVIKLK